MEAQDRRFEEAWREAFEEASTNPPVHVWDGIEDALDGKKTRKSVTRRLWLLKLAMAASVVYGMSTSGLNLHEKAFTFDDWLQGEELTSEVAEQYIDTATPYVQQALSPDDKELILNRDELNALSSSPLLAEATFSPADIYGLPVLPYYHGNDHRSIATMVNFSGGASGGGMALANNQFMENSMVQMAAEASAVSLDGPIFNLGIGFKARLNENWVLLSGLNYQERNGTGSAHYVHQTGKGKSVWAGGNAEGVNLTEVGPYNVDHRLQYVSVPVQVGYVLIDDKVDVTVYGGISNDVLVGHKVSDPEKQLASANLTDSSSFRRYGLSGIVSAEVSYDINDNYTVGVYPQVRKAITSLTKEGDNRPLALEMGVRLSYNIN